MRRITKFGSVAIALLIGVPAFLSLDLFDGAAAAGPPLLYSEASFDPITRITYPDTAPTGGIYTYGYVAAEPGGDIFSIRERRTGGFTLYSSTTPGAISAIATDRDGSDYVYGGAEGHFVWITSRASSFDTELVFRTGSPVTGVALEPNGAWAAAVTHHGDVYLFQRSRLIDMGTFVWHHKAPMLAGGAPIDPDALPDDVRDAEPTLFGEASLRPYTQVTLAGSATAQSPNGLFVVAATAFSEIWVFDAAQGAGPAGASALRPETYVIGDGECQDLPITGFELEAPCTREATARLIAQVDRMSGSVANPVLGPVQDAIRGLYVTDPVYGLVPLGEKDPLIFLDATRGAASFGNHLVVAARASGEVQGIQIHSGSSVPATSPTTLVPLWRLEDLGDLTSLDLSSFFGNTGTPFARLVIGDTEGRIRSYNASVVDIVNPTLDFVFETSGDPIRAVTVSSGFVGDNRAGVYIAYATETRAIRLLDASRRTTSGDPNEMWAGTLPILADVNDIAVSGSGSVLVASSGLMLYGGVPTVFIESSDTTRKGSTFTARAVTTAPDSPIATYAWTIEPVSGGTPTTYSSSTIEHVFTAEGRYRLRVTVTDGNGFTATANREVGVGGASPILEMNAPIRAAINESVTFRFNGTHDPDAAEGLGLASLTLFPFGNATAIEVPLDTLEATVVYHAIGDYTASAKVTDLDGRKAEGEHRITIADGGWCIPEDQNPDSDDGCSDPDPPPDDDDEPPTNGTDPTNGAPNATFTVQVSGFVVSVDASASSDPDGDPITYEWRFGDGSTASGATAQHAYAFAGIYTIRLSVEDDRGGRGVANQTVTIQLCGPANPLTYTGNFAYTRLMIAEGSGHTVSFGAAGADAGRFDVRGPTGRLLYREPAGGPAVRAVSITDDGCHLYAGRSDGTVLYMNVTDPSDRQVVRLHAERPITHAAVSSGGHYVLFARDDGTVTLATAAFAKWNGNITTPAPLVAVHPDDHHYNVVLLTNDGRIHLIDGQGRKPGHLVSYDYAGTATAIEVTPNIDLQGRGWIFIGRSDGRMVTVKMQGHRLYPLGDAAIQAAVPVRHIVSGPMTSEGHYQLGIVTASDLSSCKFETERPCGGMAIVDSRGPYGEDVPVPRRKVELPYSPKDFAMNPEVRHFLLIHADRQSAQRYDSIWNAPQQELNGLPTTLHTLKMAHNSNAYALLSDGRLVWFYAPPLADFRAAIDDGDGLIWGERLYAKNDITFDASPSRPGTGRIVSYHWDFGDKTESTDPMPTHRYKVQGKYVLTLTVTSRVEIGRDTLLVDRYRTVVSIWDPPPVAHLAASPFDSGLNAVRVATGERVGFDASGSYDPSGGRITNYRFQYGNGYATSGTSSTANYAYQRSGTYYATVTVTDDQGFSATSNKVRILVGDRGPSGVFTWSQPERNETNGWVTHGVPVTFDGRASSDPDGWITDHEWTFPGGVVKTGAQVSHTFPAPGDAVVSLRVRDNSGTWSGPTNATIVVDDGIRLRHTQNPESGRTINPATPVTATGLVHDFTGYPDIGNGIPNVQVHVKVFYDGPLGSAPSSTPYETKTYLTGSDGEMRHNVAYNQNDIAFKPGKYRIQLVAVLDGSLNGDTEYSKTTETHFVVA